MSKIRSLYGKVLDRIDGVQEREWGMEGWCPAHPDMGGQGATRSLSIRLGSRDRLLLKCHKGCTFQAILEALGVDATEAHQNEERVRRTLVETYDYRDEHDLLLYQVCRWFPKKFTQRRPNPAYRRDLPRSDNNRPWINNIDGVRRVLYRLPGLLRARERPDRPWVFIHEGEKAVNAAWHLGLTATCSSGGAGKWLLTDCTHLEGFRVAVLPDCHDTGEAHGKTVCQTLTGLAEEVRVLRLPGLPEGGDFADWLTAIGAWPAYEADRRSVRSQLWMHLQEAPLYQLLPEEIPEGLRQVVGAWFRSGAVASMAEGWGQVRLGVARLEQALSTAPEHSSALRLAIDLTAQVLRLHEQLAKRPGDGGPNLL